jgi:hypothetical protein
MTDDEAKSYDQSDITFASTDNECDSKYHFMCLVEREGKHILESVHIGAAFGKTPEEALEQMFYTYDQRGYTRPIEQWQKAIDEHGDDLGVSVVREHPDDVDFKS